MVEELYNHTGLDGRDFDAMDVRNVAYVAAAAGKAREYFAAARESFDVLAPPTVPP